MTSWQNIRDAAAVTWHVGRVNVNPIFVPMKIRPEQNADRLTFCWWKFGALRNEDYIKLNQKSVIILSKMPVDEIRAARYEFACSANVMNNNWIYSF